MNKVAIAELITASAILFTISVFTITPFLLQNSPVLNKDEIRFKRVLINLTNNVEFHSESNLLPSLLFYPFSLLQESAELLTTTKFSLKSSKHFLFRFIPAFCSTLIAPIFCAILQIEGSSLLTAFSISLLLPLDSSFIIRSRFFLPDSFIYLFSVLSLLFFSLSLRKYSALFLNLSILFSSLSFWSDYQTVLVISYMIVRLVGCYKIGEITKSQFIQFILTLSCCIISVGFIVSVVHIGLQCGPSNIYSLSQKLFNEFIDLFKFSFDKDFLFTAKFSIPIVTQKIKIVPNFTFLVLFILGFIASVFRKKWNLSLHIILAVLSSLLYNDYIMNHLQMCYIFGLLSIVPFIEQIVGSHSKKVSYLIMALSIALYLGGFPSTYGRQLSFRHMDEL